MFEIKDNRRFQVVKHPTFPPGNWLLMDMRAGRAVPTHLYLFDDLAKLARKMNAAYEQDRTVRS